ncbi:hypothetical protein, partial [Salmonella sp. hn-h4]|uniref:hypothetical protein n=1 Tax=Salmonella sp. hn-h4 TaxID=2582612 RepID=UPI001F304420
EMQVMGNSVSMITSPLSTDLTTRASGRSLHVSAKPAPKSILKVLIMDAQLLLAGIPVSVN